MYKERQDLKSFNSEYLECVFLEMKRRGEKPIITGSIYHPPNSKPKKFNYQYQSLLTKLKTEKKEIILGMDHNLDLLKSSTHVETQTFIDKL